MVMKNVKRRKALGYRRLSDRDQSKYSLGYQQKAIEDYCQRHDLELIAIYTDNGECSDTFDRPDYRALEDFIKKHKGEVHYLLVMDHDRFSRNLPEALMKIQELQIKFAIKVLATNEDIDTDAGDPDVFMQRAFRYLMANQELLRIRQRTRNGIRQAQLQGRHVNKAPFGYKNVRDANDRSLLEMDEENAPVVKWMFEQFVAGVPNFQILSDARRKGFKRSGNNALANLLSNCIYAGLIRVKADNKNPACYVRGLHQPIVSEFIFWQVQEKLGGRKEVRRISVSDAMPLRGTLQCWCGRYMTGAYSKGKKHRYLYYWCKEHRKANFSGRMLHEMLDQVLMLVSLPPERMKAILKSVRQKLEERTPTAQPVMDARRSQIMAVDVKIESLEEKYINGQIDFDAYQRWKPRLVEEKSSLETEYRSMLRRAASARNDKMKILSSIKNIHDIFDLCSPLYKQRLLRHMFKSLVFKDSRFEIALNNSYFSSSLQDAGRLGLVHLVMTKPFIPKV